MTVAAVWRSEFIERLKATGNVTLAAAGTGVNRQNAYRAPAGRHGTGRPST